jgi:hypothetical protein
MRVSQYPGLTRHDTMNTQNYVIFKLLIRHHHIVVHVAFDVYIDVRAIKTIPITLTSYRYTFFQPFQPQLTFILHYIYCINYWRHLQGEKKGSFTHMFHTTVFMMFKHAHSWIKLEINLECRHKLQHENNSELRYTSLRLWSESHSVWPVHGRTGKFTFLFTQQHVPCIELSVHQNRICASQYPDTATTWYHKYTKLYCFQIVKVSPYYCSGRLWCPYRCLRN